VLVKRFEQYCPLAHALSLVGERWSLLIVRDLLRGPRRYTDLAQGLPGIGTNILAARLRELEAAGIVAKRKLPPPWASTVYELTDYGAELKEALYSLARWGARTLGPPQPDEELYPEWGVSGLAALFDAAAAQGLTETYVFVVDGDAFTARVVNGSLSVSLGAANDADAVVETDMATFFALATGELELRDAAERGLARIDGDPKALDRCFRVFSLTPRAAAVA
jgi:DNA-binding HxlR family transcriptional regulator